MPKQEGRFVITEHARFEMGRRGIPEELVESVVSSPEQCCTVRPGRIIMQSRVVRASRTFLVRVVVDTDMNPQEVVTAYLTSKIGKYWRQGR
jgi:hypothetical protein